MRRAWLVALLLGGCGSGGGPDICADAPTFTNDIRPIAQQKCVQCHSQTLVGDARNGAPAGLDFDTYETTQPNIQAFADAISSGREPPMGLDPPVATSAAERDTVSRWRLCSFPE